MRCFLESSSPYGNPNGGVRAFAKLLWSLRFIQTILHAIPSSKGRRDGIYISSEKNEDSTAIINIP
jgi:hypothetical protein